MVLKCPNCHVIHSRDAYENTYFFHKELYCNMRLFLHQTLHQFLLLHQFSLPGVTICEIHKNAFNPVFTLYSSSLGIFRTSYNFIFNIFCYFGKQFRTSVLNLIPRNMCLNEMDNDTAVQVHFAVSSL